MTPAKNVSKQPLPVIEPSRVDIQDPDQRETHVATDLVEYLIIVVPDLGSLAQVASSLADLVAARIVRILDLVVLAREGDGAVVTFDPGSVESMGPLDLIDISPGGLLSDHDIELSSLALPPGTAGVIVVTEDRWAESLAVAARSAGGSIVAGDRIPPRRVEAVLADQSEEGLPGG